MYCCRIVHGRDRAQRSWWHANTARMLLLFSFLMHRCSFVSHTTRSSLVGCPESRWLSRARYSVNLPLVAILFRSLCDCTISVFSHPPTPGGFFVFQEEGGSRRIAGLSAASLKKGTPCVIVILRRVFVSPEGWSPPSWRAVADGERPDMRQPEEFEPGMPRGGWQHEAASRAEQHNRDADLFPRLNASGEALVRSQAGPGAGLHSRHVPRVASPTSGCSSSVICTSIFLWGPREARVLTGERCCSHFAERLVPG